MSADEWRPVPGAPGYEVSRARQVRSLERVLIRRNGSPYRVRARVLRPMRQPQRTGWYVKLGVGQRGRCRTIYLSDRFVERIFGATDEHTASSCPRTQVRDFPITTDRLTNDPS